MKRFVAVAAFVFLAMSGFTGKRPHNGGSVDQAVMYAQLQWEDACKHLDLKLMESP
jgi:hypothetical protein